MLRKSMFLIVALSLLVMSTEIMAANLVEKCVPGKTPGSDHCSGGPLGEYETTPNDQGGLDYKFPNGGWTRTTQDPDNPNIRYEFDSDGRSCKKVASGEVMLTTCSDGMWTRMTFKNNKLIVYEYSDGEIKNKIIDPATGTTTFVQVRPPNKK